jgi:hypothetical protein
VSKKERSKSLSIFRLPNRRFQVARASRAYLPSVLGVSATRNLAFLALPTTSNLSSSPSNRQWLAQKSVFFPRRSLKPRSGTLLTLICQQTARKSTGGSSSSSTASTLFSDFFFVFLQARLLVNSSPPRPLARPLRWVSLRRRRTHPRRRDSHDPIARRNRRCQEAPQVPPWYRRAA